YVISVFTDLILFLLHSSFFFFQAEDGIRDFHVTGVQTCALPIFSSPPSTASELTITTGKGCRRITSASIVRPSIRGISRSSVTTWGRKNSILFKPSRPSRATATTLIAGSDSNICLINWRINAESSTTRTVIATLARPFSRSEEHTSELQS